MLTTPTNGRLQICDAIYDRARLLVKDAVCSQQSSRAVDSLCFMIRSLGVLSKPSTTASVSRHLVGSEARGEPGEERSRLQTEARLELDEELYVLLADVSHDADHRAILDGRMLGRDVLDLPSRDVLTAAPQVIRQATVEPEMACGAASQRGPSLGRRRASSALTEPAPRLRHAS